MSLGGMALFAGLSLISTLGILLWFHNLDIKDAKNKKLAEDKAAAEVKKQLEDFEIPNDWDVDDEEHW